MPAHDGQDDEVEVELTEGMAVASGADDAPLGTLAGLLQEEDEDEAEFLLVRDGAGERLVPFDAVVGVGDGTLLLGVARLDFERFPVLAADADPTDEDVEKAYAVYDSVEDEGASD